MIDQTSLYPLGERGGAIAGCSVPSIQGSRICRGGIEGWEGD